MPPPMGPRRAAFFSQLKNLESWRAFFLSTLLTLGPWLNTPSVPMDDILPDIYLLHGNGVRWIGLERTGGSAFSQLARKEEGGREA